MDPVDYLAASYFERWLWSAEQGLLRKGTIAAAGEVEHMMERLAAGGPEPPPHRNPGQAARAVERLEVLPMQPATRPRFVAASAARCAAAAQPATRAAPGMCAAPLAWWSACGGCR